MNVLRSDRSVAHRIHHSIDQWVNVTHGLRAGNDRNGARATIPSAVAPGTVPGGQPALRLYAAGATPPAPCERASRSAPERGRATRGRPRFWPAAG